jgi:hypothetical protein
MRLALFPLVLSALSASASVLTSFPLAARRDPIALLARQEQVPIPTNLSNSQLETSYAAQCSAVNSATGQSAIQADIAAATSNSLAIDVRFKDLE